MRFLSILLSFALIACSSPEEDRFGGEDMTVSSLADQVIEDGQTLSTLLQTVNDEQSAEAVRPRIEAMVDDYDALQDRLEGMEAPSISEMSELMKRAPKMAEVQSELITEIRRINNDHPEAAQILRNSFETMEFQP